MYVELKFSEKLDQGLYEDYCKFIFQEIKVTTKQKMNPLKYQVRESFVLNSKVIKWTYKPLSIDLVYYMNHCLEMKKVRGVYVIRLNEKTKVKGSKTKVSTLIRLLEYGNEVLKPLPLIRVVMSYYRKNYPYLLKEFFERRLSE